MTSIETVSFYQHALITAERDGEYYVAMRPLVAEMGLQWAGQQQRIQRDAVLNQGVCIIHTPAGSGGIQKTLFLSLSLLPGWLATISTNRIKRDDVRERVQLFQREAYRVLAEHFLKKDEPAPPRQRPVDVEEITGDYPINIALSMTREARQIYGAQAAREVWWATGLLRTPSMRHFEQQDSLFDWSEAPAITAEEGL